CVRSQKEIHFQAGSHHRLAPLSVPCISHRDITGRSPLFAAIVLSNRLRARRAALHHPQLAPP
ncbi:MAG TPA: hypothetical protein VGG81_09840, partial [Edaphobacter sp.]